MTKRNPERFIRIGRVGDRDPLYSRNKRDGPESRLKSWGCPRKRNSMGEERGKFYEICCSTEKASEG